MSTQARVLFVAAIAAALLTAESPAAAVEIRFNAFADIGAGYNFGGRATRSGHPARGQRDVEIDAHQDTAASHVNPIDGPFGQWCRPPAPTGPGSGIEAEIPPAPGRRSEDHPRSRPDLPRRNDGPDRPTRTPDDPHWPGRRAWRCLA